MFLVILATFAAIMTTLISVAYIVRVFTTRVSNMQAVFLLSLASALITIDVLWLVPFVIRNFP